MTRLTTFLSILLMSGAAFAGDFAASDKVLYFNSDVLIDVITNTFEDDVQVNVAEKYRDVADSFGNVSVADLVEVCGTGNLDNIQCKGFIRSLLDTMADNILKPFYWSDYISRDFSGGLNVYNSGDGYFHDNAGLNNGEWAIQFPWMRGAKTSAFKKQYPDTQYLRGTSACTSDSGTKQTADDSKDFASNEQSGSHCWCKMTAPEQSSWVYYDDKTSGSGGSCERSCSLGCMAQLRDYEPMRAAMFTAVKVSGTNASTTTDNAITDDLISGVKEKISTQQAKIRPLDWADTSLRGYWTCTTKTAPDIGYTTTESFDSAMLGNHCWCKYTRPNGTDWIYAGEIEPYSCASHIVPDAINACENCCSAKCDINIFYKYSK